MCGGDGSLEGAVPAGNTVPHFLVAYSHELRPTTQIAFRSALTRQRLQIVSPVRSVVISVSYSHRAIYN